MKPIIELKNVVKEYHLGGTIVRALAGVSLQIFEGDFVVIVGPSGSGKSTLMHILGTLDQPSKGDVFVNGENVKDLDDWELAMLRRNKIGFIFQSFNLIPTLTALENVVIPTNRFQSTNLLKTLQHTHKNSVSDSDSCNYARN